LRREENGKRLAVFCEAGEFEKVCRCGEKIFAERVDVSATLRPFGFVESVSARSMEEWRRLRAMRRQDVHEAGLGMDDEPGRRRAKGLPASANVL